MLKYFLVQLFSAIYFNQYGILCVEALVGLGVKQVRKNEFPFSVALVDVNMFGDRASQYFCGGTLISKEHVLTSAHCVQDETLSNIKVLMGSYILLSPLMRSYDIIDCLTYNDWAKSKRLMHSARDLAVLTLHTEAKNIVPISLSSMKIQRLEGLRVGMATWGLSVSGEVPISMEKAYVRILPKQLCQEKAFRYPLPIRDQFLQQVIMCSAADPKLLGTCGNSGSPVFDIKKRLVGIHYGVCTKLLPTDPSEANLLITIDSCRPFIRDAIGKK